MFPPTNKGTHEELCFTYLFPVGFDTLCTQLRQSIVILITKAPEHLCKLTQRGKWLKFTKVYESPTNKNSKGVFLLERLKDWLDHTIMLRAITITQFRLWFTCLSYTESGQCSTPQTVDWFKLQKKVFFFIPTFLAKGAVKDEFYLYYLASKWTYRIVM